MEDVDMQAKLIETKNVMEEKVMQLHTDGGISDKMLLHTIGMYKDSNNKSQEKCQILHHWQTWLQLSAIQDPQTEPR